MGARLIYDGGLSVAASDYVHSVLRGDGYADEEVADLDVRVTRSSRLSFTLEYPFTKPFDGAVIAQGGATLRQIIDAIRSGFRVMYRGASQEALPNLANVQVEGDYGLAYHAIGDLVIECIELDEDAARLHVGIGS